MIYLDCFQGASGDMLVGALLDIEPDHGKYFKKMRDIGLLEADVKVEKLSSSGISGTRPLFRSSFTGQLNDYVSINSLIARLGLIKEVKEQVLSVYRIIFEAESEVHGVPVDKVHLHELAGPAKMLEIISFFILLNGRKVFASELTLGFGTICSAHGEIPLPAPVTAVILRGIPVSISTRIKDKEFVTPTAAAILKSVCDFEAPRMKILSAGYGIGKNSALRVLCLDEIYENCHQTYQVEANIDDMTAEDMSALAEELLFVSSDVYVLPALMKKGRPGHILTVLAGQDVLPKVKDIILHKSSSAGLRYWPTQKVAVPRDIVEFDSSYGKCRIKIQYIDDNSVKIKPEFDDLKLLSERTGERVSSLREKIKREYLDE
jgi:uncharacterized protein (TIGR00299 family) protein